MKRWTLVLMLLGPSSFVHADMDFWFGPEGLYFHPSNWKIQRMLKTFWGWGGEAGWSYRHFEVGLEANYVQANGKFVFEQTEVGRGVVGNFWEHLSALAVTPRVAFRLWPQRTPYAGVGVGYHKMSWCFQGLQDQLFDTEESSSGMSTELFGGYDYRLSKWGGVRGELGYRMPEPVERDKVWLYHNYRDMRGWKTSLGAYVTW